MTPRQTWLALIPMWGLFTINFGLADPFKPPVLPEAFSVHFAEIKKQIFSDGYISSNNGSWYYDYNHRTARFDHLKGQHDDFCMHQNLSDHEPDAPCHLLFTPTEDMYVHYPEQKTCCWLCGKEQGCTILRPDWMEGGTMYATEFINGLSCYGWVKQGARSNGDILLVTYDIVPCRYSEVLINVSHNLTFYPGTYVIGPQNPDLFTVPDYCHKKCPRPFPTPGLHKEKFDVFGIP